MVLRKGHVDMISGIEYQCIDDEGLHIIKNGDSQCLAVDNIIVCAGQVSVDETYQALTESNKQRYIIGGAYKAAELDAVSAIRQGVELAAKL